MVVVVVAVAVGVVVAVAVGVAVVAVVAVGVAMTTIAALPELAALALALYIMKGR